MCIKVELEAYNILFFYQQAITDFARIANIFTLYFTKETIYSPKIPGAHKRFLLIIKRCVNILLKEILGSV
jgi:hypothetical protein